MKTIYYIPPVLSLAIAAAWLTSNQRSINSLEQETAKLQDQITAARPPELAIDQKTTTHQNQSTSSDWKKIARNLESPGNAELLEKLVSEMSDTELCKALDELASLQLSDDASYKLRDMLNDALAEKNPEMALNRFMEETGGTLSSGPALTAFENFLKLDSAAATAWLDRNIAAGAFPETIGGVNFMLARLEELIIMPLVKTNPAEAARRLNQMGTMNKTSIIDKAFDQIGLGDKAAFASFFRSTVPEDEREHRMAYFISNRFKGDAGKVKSYLEHFGATPQERVQVLESITQNAFAKAADHRNVTREDLDSYRTWMESVEPTLVNKALGIGLAQAIDGRHQGMTFDQAAAIATEYHAAGGGDDVLVPLLQSHQARFNKDVRESVLKFAAQLSNEQLRQKLLSELK